MFKLAVLVFATLFAVATAGHSYLASQPVVYTSHVVQPVVRTHYAAVPVVKHVVTPVVHTVAAVPAVHSVAHHTVAAPVIHSVQQHSYATVPIFKSFAPAYVPFKKH